MSDRLGVIVLAAGKGTRMRSALPKVLHPIAGTPMVQYVIDAARALEPARIAVVVGHGAEEVCDALKAPDLQFVDQPEQLGTADAVGRCREALAGCDRILALTGDTPLIESGLLADLVAALTQAPVTFATANVADATHLGRVRRDASGAVEAIIEAGEASSSEGTEINAGQLGFEADWLWAHLDGVEPSATGERYHTKLPAAAYAEGRPAASVEADATTILGVDDRANLAQAETLMRRRLIAQHLEAGVTFTDADTVYVDRDVRLAADVRVEPNCYLYGTTSVAAGAVVGPGATLRNATIGRESAVQHSVVEDSAVGERTVVGPFAHVRGGATIGDDCEIHNYAEVKNSVVGNGVKMHHFSYLGDADVGEGTNIGAGMVTVNFDGIAKHRTAIGKNAFVGCDTMLIAPVSIGDGAFTAAGAVVTRDVAAGVRVAGVPARELKPKREGRP